jgi:hypothetical protein
VPYLNERNVVANVPLAEGVLDHPDRESNPLASAPGKAIFAQIIVNDEPPMDMLFEDNMFKEDNVIEINEKKVNVVKHEEIATDVKAPVHKVTEINNNDSLMKLFKAESEKNVMLMNQNRELKLLLDQAKTGTPVERQKLEEVINDLRIQNQRLSDMLRKKPVHSVIENRVIGK